MNRTWRTSPILGVTRVRQAAEYYRDVLGFTLDPVDGVFQPYGIREMVVEDLNGYRIAFGELA